MDNATRTKKPKKSRNKPGPPRADPDYPIRVSREFYTVISMLSRGEGTGISQCCDRHLLATIKLLLAARAKEVTGH